MTVGSGGGGDASLPPRYDHEWSLLSAVAFITLILYGFVRICCCIVGSILRSTSDIQLWKRRSSTASSSNSNRTESVPHDKSKLKSITTVIIILASMFAALDLNALFLNSTNQHRDDGLVDLIHGTSPKLKEILKRVPLLKHGPSPPWWLRNRHIQFVPWLIQNELQLQYSPIPYQRVNFTVHDCVRKSDTNSQCTKTMPETITLDIFPPLDNHDYPGFHKASPVIVYSPGLRCHSQDIPGTSTIRRAYGKGFRNIVVHRRGHTPQQPLTSPRWNLYGDVQDLEQVYWYVTQHLVSPETAMFLHGISSGTALTVTALAKWDYQRRTQKLSHDKIPSFVASVDITPGYDIATVLNRQRFLFPYNDLLLQGVKDHFVIQNEAVLRQYNSTAVDEMLASTNLQDFVDSSVLFAGYDNVSHYYDDINPINELRDIQTPKLVLNAVDDPCCNIRNLYEQSPYPRHEGKTFAKMISETSNGMVAVTRTGSHCPFLSYRHDPDHGGESTTWWSYLDPISRLFVVDPLSQNWMLHSWADEVAIEYFLAALEVYHDNDEAPDECIVEET